MSKKRKLNIQKLFCLISVLFIIAVILVYGFKMIMNKKVYNKELIADTIIKNETIKKEGNVYLFKGKDVNNYILVSGMLFRIVKVNVDGSVDVVLSDSINALGYNSTTNYIDSDINKYLNDVFLSSIDKKYLSKTVICTDVVSDINNYSCKNKNTDNYVKLMDVADYLNTFDTDSYIASEEPMWLSSMKDSENAWVVSHNTLAYLNANSNALVRPVITLKNSLSIVAGTGVKNNPYLLEIKNEIRVGSYVEIDDDMWIVYSITKDKLNLVSYNNINNGVTKYKYSNESIKFTKDDENSLANYLNTTYYDSLSYKNILQEFEICTGEYDGKYSNVCSTKEKVKVGVPTVIDLKFSGNNYEYYLSSGNGDKAYYYDLGLYLSQPNLIKPIRPTISIKKPNQVNGKGIYNNPYVIEVK